MKIEIIDDISGIFNTAVLRWRPKSPLSSSAKNQFSNDKICVLETEVASANRLVTAITILPEKAD